MLFCDPIYFCFLLPLTAVVYWKVIAKKHFTLAIPVLILASIIFYVTWSWKFFLLLCFSATINYIIGCNLLKSKQQNKFLLTLGILFNLGLLGYFKYFNFFIDNCNNFLGTHWQVGKIILPLGISFYTFQQLAYIIDAYKRIVNPCSFWQYLLFVIYFPQLVAGPIVHYQEMMPQFGAQREVRWDLMWRGLCIFIGGLFKKVMIADTLARFVQTGFSHVDQLAFLSSWLISLSYTFQLYFDFSGYADMAIGSGLLFGIKLPENFNSPYKALDIQDFWRRWHMTLSTWLKNYIYFPLGGSRCSTLQTCCNLFLTFFIGGIWHGAGWTFIIWGSLHGFAALIHRLWLKTGFHLNKILAWLITFNFVNIAWIFFRSDKAKDACTILKKMFDVSFLKNIKGTTTLTELKNLINGTLFAGNQHLKLLFAVLGCLFLVLCLPNIKQLYERYGKPFWLKTLTLSGLFWWLVYTIASRSDKIEFLYWQF